MQMKMKSTTTAAAVEAAAQEKLQKAVSSRLSCKMQRKTIQKHPILCP
jgi:hypothetical protein